MAIRVFAYNHLEDDRFMPVAHGAVRRIDQSGEVMIGYPDRGRRELGAGSHNKAMPLCFTENFMICTRFYSNYNIDPETMVYAAPLRNEYTYSSGGSGNYTFGVRGFLYNRDYTPDTSEVSGTTIPGVDEVEYCHKPMAVWLGGDKALVLWNENGGELLMAMCEPSKPSRHRQSPYYGYIPTPLAVGVDKSGNVRIAARWGETIRVSSPVSIAGFGSTDSEIEFGTVFPDGAEGTEVMKRPNDMYAGIAALALVMGDNLIKIVGYTPVFDYLEGIYIAGVTQVVAVPPNTGGRIAIYSPDIASLNTIIYQGELEYSAGPTSISFNLSLPTEWFNADAAMGSRWVAAPVADFYSADASLSEPPAPVFWRGLVRTQERA